MTVPIPPTDGPISVEARLAAQDNGVSPDIQAPLPDLDAMAASAVSDGKAWCAGAAEWAESPQGAGLGGFTLGGDTPGDWDSNVSFPHQGP